MSISEECWDDWCEECADSWCTHDCHEEPEGATFYWPPAPVTTVRTLLDEPTPGEIAREKRDADV